MTMLVKIRAYTHAVFGKLRSALFAFIFLIATPFVTAAADSISDTDTNRVLRTVAEVRKLTREQALLKLPVQLNGVITYWGPRWHCFFSDETGGIFLNVKLPEERQ